MAKSDDFFFGTSAVEANEELDAVNWAQKNGWQSRKIEYVGRRGCPDRLFYGYGILLLVEVKRPSARRKARGGLSALQEKEFGRYSEASVPVKVCYTADEIINYLKGFMPK